MATLEETWSYSEENNGYPCVVDGKDNLICLCNGRTWEGKMPMEKNRIHARAISTALEGVTLAHMLWSRYKDDDNISPMEMKLKNLSKKILEKAGVEL